MRKTCVNIARLLLAAVFVFSGFVKAVDPRGTQYKINDYLDALIPGNWLPDGGVLVLAVVLAAVEFCLGIFMLFAIQRRLTSRLMLAMLIVMTPLTLWLAIANPVSDCGCFGDAVVLTNWQTFWKNVVLLVLAVVVVRRPFDMFRFVSETNQWIVKNYTALFVLAVSVWCLYDLPLFDFRPYHVGANIKEGMEVPEDAEQPVFATTFILEKEGVRRTFTLEDYPDSTWTFVDTRTVQTKAGYVPPIHDFSITTAEGEEITNEVLSDAGYTFLLVSPHLEDADDSRFDLINELFEYAKEHGYPFYGLTASSEQGIALWREMTGAEYDFCHTDEITLKTMIRSNPGLILLKQGTVVRKWSHNDFPEIAETNTALPLEDLEIGQMSENSVPRRLAGILLWFVLPLVLLTIADRTWMWTKWLRRKRRKPIDNNSLTPNNNNEHEKENCSR